MMGKRLHQSYEEDDSYQITQPKEIELSQKTNTQTAENANLEYKNLIYRHQQMKEVVNDRKKVPVFPQQNILANQKGMLLPQSTLEELKLYTSQVEWNCPVGEAVKIFKANPILPGIIITQEHQFVGIISRRLFFEYMSRPHSWQLFSKFPINAIYQLIKKPTIILPINTPIVEAAKQSLQRSPELLYEPIAVENEQGEYQILDVHNLMTAQSEIHESLTAALMQAEIKYRCIYENAVDGIFQTTPDGQYISVNPALARIYGYNSPEEMIHSITNIDRQLYVEPNRRHEFMAAIEKNRSVSQFESQVYRRDGSIIWISENARAVYNENGSLLYYEGAVEDITERKQAEVALRHSEAKLRKQATELATTLHQLKQTQAKLIQTEKMSTLGQLLAGVAHEINNPVNAISNNLPCLTQCVQGLLELLAIYEQIISEETPEIIAKKAEIEFDYIQEDLPRIMSAMSASSERIREIALSLRNFSRMDEGKKKLADIHQGIDSTLLILHHRLKAKGELPEIKIIKNYGELPHVKCALGQLSQVFINLIGNSIDALEQRIKQNDPNTPAPTIWIGTEVVDKNRVRICIADNGQGIAEENLPQLFEPFYTTKPVGKGTGLGLSISKQIITEKHGGKIECHSKLGEGAKFLIELPISQSE
ncbi:ATP-binding protein [Floridanema aerugineum]|uniref:histidine kinase n=1 Tax=Floridaenema aerugineum BLCC-F46 TaxID=3153654 RepID=A0ABV4XAD2_9CYAN